MSFKNKTFLQYFYMLEDYFHRKTSNAKNAILKNAIKNS